MFYREAQPRDRLAELGSARAVPGYDAVESLQSLDQPRRRVDFQHVEPGRTNRADRIGEADERHVLLGHPNFEVFGSQRFERGKGDDQIADRPRPDQQPAHQPGGRILEMSLYSAKTVTTIRN